MVDTYNSNEGLIYVPSNISKEDKPVLSILKINLIIFFIYFVIAFSSSLISPAREYDVFGRILIPFFLSIAQMGINWIMGIGSLFFKDYRKNAGAFFLSGLIILLIGFGSCFAIAFANGG